MDPAVLGRLDQEIGGVREVVDAYLEALPGRCEEVARAVEGADADAVARVAHTLRTASAFLGAVGLAQLCAVLEHEAASGRPVPASRAGQVADMARRVERELRALTRPAHHPNG